MGDSLSDSLRRFHSRPVANPAAVVGGQGETKYRFTLLTSGLLRYEYAEDGIFEDRASTFAINRDLPVPDYEVIDTESTLEIATDHFHLRYDKLPFSPGGLRVQVKGGVTSYHSEWRYGGTIPNCPPGMYELGGTARTLDEANGRIPLGPGVIAANGFSALDDSHTMLFTDDGWVAGRRPGARIDGYLFAYGFDYKAAVKALYTISGKQPLLPRWSLGNWWSRYYKYTADEYLELMDRFRAEGIPMSVAVLDMDWHWVDDERVRKSGLSGWTGYSWQRELFPDPQAFLAELHKRDLKVTPNDHPADGVAKYEDVFEKVCKALGRDPRQTKHVPFEATDPKFLNAYFNVVLRALEDDGIDFWWVDWQQGEFSAVPGVDPLWVLNHYHFLANARGGKRPLTFSRFAGPGSHRYPVGFSGDTHVTWDSLDFQPEFTATSSNIGFGWWSHDIGGHLKGYKDFELTTRWVQLGVFSPILRLHSCDNPFVTKEPWSFNKEAQIVMTDALRLRHQLIPYLYSMNVRAARADEPLVQPVYWYFPRRKEAYRHKNTFFFGSELLVAPFTSPRDNVTRRARTAVWLPPGRHVDVFSGVVYDGDREILVYRPLDGYAVFAKEGSIIPFDAAKEPANGGKLPDSVELKIVVGADASFDLIEDDDQGVHLEEASPVSTPINFTQQTGTLTVGPSSSTSTIPSTRHWLLSFLSLESSSDIKVEVDGVEKKARVSKSATTTSIYLESVPSTSKITIQIGNAPQLVKTDAAYHTYPVIHEAQMPFTPKLRVWDVVQSKTPITHRLSQLQAMDLDRNLLGAISEYLLADSRV
ncbi:glycoside hydrolase family 31 protein [Xylona heveae TC161]|uniref:alpha-glucosidase n=1 Tax=Xylona heveae (strain CBS 132557 / TC161) TaxID=1328760 RepID=A0A164ZDJ0_XYLHT|nr:glycoside hydrolase family 31 protein [Xylona heveae TC161]KZF18963.1 glycoside hydrolase family 31 protein [Xylona heveae TC161]